VKTSNNKDMKYTRREIIEKTKANGMYLTISIDRVGNILIPSDKSNYLGSGVITIYRETLEEIIEEVNNNQCYDKKYGSPYGNETCKFS